LHHHLAITDPNIKIFTDPRMLNLESLVNVEMKKVFSVKGDIPRIPLYLLKISYLNTQILIN